MNDFVFEHYAPVAQLTIAIVLPLMLGAVLFTRKTNRLQAAAVALIAYIAIVALGMSGNIKHLSLIGVVHGLVAFVIAALAARHLEVRAGRLLFVPCFFIVVVGKSGHPRFSPRFSPRNDLWKIRTPTILPTILSEERPSRGLVGLSKPLEFRRNLPRSGRGRLIGCLQTSPRTSWRRVQSG